MAGRRYNRPPRAEAPEINYQALLDNALTGEARMSEVYSQGKDYSYLNQQWVTYQILERGMSVAPIANMQWWNEHGRRIIKGSSAFFVVRPILKKHKTLLDENGDPLVYTSFTPSKSAFTYDQTEGEPLPEVEPKDWHYKTMFGNLAINLIQYEELSLNKMGYSYGRNAAINPMAPYPEKTAVHEAAHIEAGHTGEEFDYDQHRGHAEVEAETTAFIVGHEVGFNRDVPGMRHYIQSYRDQEWGKTGEPGIPESSIRKIFKLSDLLRKAGYQSQEAETEGAA
ncbi:hypothetical protein [Mycobacteroides abscessus]|uniref:hypothetical protein n=1 Tax=Mycobacteroides abscessus TaxID=36809 RepID=UPI000C259BFA|nr:hypothetical protein [Mycobacteroides abscessus]